MDLVFIILLYFTIAMPKSSLSSSFDVLSSVIISCDRVFVKFLNSSAHFGNNRDQNNYLLKTCYTALSEVAGTQIEIAE